MPSLFFLALLFISAKMMEMDFSYLSRDPIQTLNSKPYVGVLSNTGIFFWCFTIAILFFSTKIAHDLGRPKILYHFFLSSGLLTLLMMIDDIFLMHDVIFPEYLHLSEYFFYIFYGSSVVAILYFFRKIILESDYILFLLAFALLASSVITDILLVIGVKVPSAYFVEDGSKFLGIISWFIYFVRVCYTHIKPAPKGISL